MKNIKPLLFFLGLVLANGLSAQNVEFENIQIINEEELDFSPIPYSNGLMYTSSKGDRFLQCPPQDNQQYTDLYFAAKNDDGSFQEPVKLKGGVNGKYNDGVPTFTPDGNTMAFTRNNLRGKNELDVIDLKIYFATLEDGRWVNVESFAHNDDLYSTCHPAYSPDGKLMVFSSNRPSSNEGSMDLWAVRKDETGVWGIPFNLGPSVNTSGNELFPYIDNEGILFFSSDGHPGEGNLDIFAATNDDYMDADEWEMVGNIGTPFNTPADEVAFVPIAGATEGYLSSDNSFAGAEGMDDIYKWTREPDMFPARIQVVDKGTGDPIEGADVGINLTAFQNPSYQKYGPVLDLLYNPDGAEIMYKPDPLEQLTDGEGMLPPMRVYPGSAFNINADKKGYKAEVRTPNFDQLTEKDVYVIPLERQFATLTVLVIEDPGDAPIPMADIIVKNKRTGEIVDLTGDGEGTATTQIDCNDDYEITARKAGYTENSKELVDYELDCADGDVRVIIPLKKMPIVILEPIFYDFDESYIREKDAQPTLNELVNIMNKYPSLVIMLSANTDNRGSNDYNERLAQRRYRAAKKYLTDKGIDTSRLQTKGNGETSPFIDCEVKVSCSEAEHQLNRRVDVIRVSDSEDGVIFQTRDINTMNIESDRR